MHYLLAFALFLTTIGATAQTANTYTTSSPLTLKALKRDRATAAMLNPLPGKTRVTITPAMLQLLADDRARRKHEYSCFDNVSYIVNDTARRKRLLDSLNLLQRTDGKGEGAAPTQQSTLDNKPFERMANGTAWDGVFRCPDRRLKVLRTDTTPCKGQLDGLYLQRRSEEERYNRKLRIDAAALDRRRLGGYSGDVLTVHV